MSDFTLGTPEIEYTTLVDDLGFNGFYFKSSNKIYLPPQLKENPELLRHVVKHEAQHYENTKKVFPIRLICDILLDYKDVITSTRLKGIQQPYPITEEIYSLLYDSFTFPINIGKKHRLLKIIILGYFFFILFSWVLL